MNNNSTLHTISRRMAVWVMVMLGCVGVTNSQSLSVYNINTTGFPLITADYVAFDAGGFPLNGDTLTKNHFSVQEQASAGPVNDLNASVRHWCDTETKEPEATILIILDRSSSMHDVIEGGKTRFQYAKDAIKAFVQKIRFIGETRVCLTTFSGNYEVKVKWTANPQEVIDTLNKLEPTSSTNYELPFTQQGTNVFELLKQRPPNLAKYVFFLTDGHPNPAIGAPNASQAAERKFVDETTAKFQQQGARFYAISINVTETHWTIQEIARATGGKSILTNEKGLVDIFSLLALETQTTTICHLSWISPYVCYADAQNRNVTITLKLGQYPKVQTTYITPPISVASVVVSDPVLYCGDPLPNTASLATVTITAKNGPLHVTGYSISPPTYFTIDSWNPPAVDPNFVPFTIDAGKSKQIRIKFTQGTPQTFRQAKLRLEGTTCPPEIDLVGGQGMVVLSSPNGGQLYSTCDTITISWAGVLPTQPVALDYSEDDGANWNPITQTATGLKYKWLPPSPGTRYRVRVKISPVDQVQWIRQMGGSGNETHTSLALACDDLHAYVTGYFNGPTRFGATTANNQVGNIDGYLNEFDTDGLLTKTTLLIGTGNNDDRVIGAITDSLCNLYVTGYFTSPNANFGNLGLTLMPFDKKNMFLYKFDRSGSLVWARYGRGTSANGSTAGVDSIGISYDVNGYPRIIIAGKFQRFLNLGLNASGTGQEQSANYNNNTDRSYYAIYDANGGPTGFYNAVAPSVGWRYQTTKAVDGLGFTYETGTYTGTKTVGPPQQSIPNAGGTDTYISKTGAIPSSSDMSDAPFTVKAPTLSFTINKAVMTSVAQGQSSPNSFQGILCNTGDFPVTISDTNLVGSYPSDFRLINNIIGTRLAPGACINLEFEFIPSDTGVRNATLIVVGNCAATASVELEGIGLPPCVYEVRSIIDLGKIPMGVVRYDTLRCLIKNTGPKDILVTPTITGSPEITIFQGGGTDIRVRPGGCLPDVIIKIDPTSGGLKTVVFDFGLLAECGVPTSTVTVEVVEPKVTINNVDLGRIRLGGFAYDTIRITNLQTTAVVITGVTATNHSTPHLAFTLPTIPPPVTIQPNESIEVPVQFNPMSRGLHIDTVYATVQGQATPLAGEARGIGFLPALGPTGYAFQPWTVGQQSPEIGSVIIRNTDAESSLEIGNVTFAGPTAAFTMDLTALNFPVIIPIGDSIVIPARFTPMIGGKQCIDVNIEHDSKNGPGPIPPYATSTVSLCGSGIESSDIPPLVMGDVLTCASKTATVRVSNPNNALPLTCDVPIVTGDINMFTSSHMARFTIPAGQYVDISIVYTPANVGAHSAMFEYPNDQGLSLKIQASGNGVTTPGMFEFGQIITGTVGQPSATPVIVTVNNLDTVQVKQVVLTFTYDPQYLNFKDFGQPEQAGWTFTPDVSTPGQLRVIGNSNPGTTLTSGAFVTPRFDVYLTSDSTLPITFTSTVTPNCVVGTGDDGLITLELVCYAAGRMVKVGGTTFSIETPSPNPASERAEVVYSTGIELATSFEVVNSMGSVVRTIDTPVLKSGTYQLLLDVSDLSSGVYVIRMTSGPYVDSRLLHIVK